MEEYYMYFIKIDENTIKYGITKNYNNRFTVHGRKFVKDLNLGEYFKIIKIIKFNNKLLNKTVESRFKKYIDLTNNYFEKYNETEVILFNKLDEYYEHIKTIIHHIIDDYKILDGDYELFDEEQLSKITEYFINKNYMNKKIVNTQLKNIQSKNICVRCGISYKILSKHLQNRMICPANYLDINRSQILDNYNNLYNKYIEIKCLEDKKSKCNICRKFILTDNLQKHINKLHNDENIFNTNVKSLQIYSLNNFGDETNVDIKIVYKLLVEIDNDFKIDTIIKFIEELYFKIEENRNIYTTLDYEYGRIFIDNKWCYDYINIIKKKIIGNAYRHFGNIAIQFINYEFMITKFSYDDKEIIKNIMDDLYFYFRNIAKCGNTFNKNDLDKLNESIDKLMIKYCTNMKEVYKLTK